MKRRVLTLLLIVLFALCVSANAAFAELSGYFVAKSGLTNMMRQIGQTCTLTARVGWWSDWDDGIPDTWTYYSFPDELYPTPKYYFDLWNLKLVWGSTTPGVIGIEPYGDYNQFAHVVSLRMGTTNVYVRLVSTTTDEVFAEEYQQLTVDTGRSNSNIHPYVLNYIGRYNAGLSTYGEAFNLQDADPAAVEAAAFQSEFKGLYGVSASQVTEIGEEDELTLDSAAAFDAQGYAQLKPSMLVTLTPASPAGGGSLLPVQYDYTMSWDEVGELLGRDVTTLSESDRSGLFGKLGLVFEDGRGAAVSVIDAGSYARALSSGALALEDGEDELRLTLKVMLADVGASTAQTASARGASAGAAWIGGSLVVPDGAADGTSGGSMWLVKKSGGSTGTPTESGGGGGGCNAGIGALVLAAIAAGLILRRAAR